jgi:hypothetical protein
VVAPQSAADGESWAEMAEWEPLVGRALLRFGEIEVLTIRCLRFLLPDSRKLRAVGNRKFAQRVNAILKLLATDSDSEREKLAALFRNAKRLVLRRNLIAHNPLEMTVYQHGETGEFILSPEIRRLLGGDKDFVDRAALEAFVGEVTALRTALRVASYDAIFGRKKRRRPRTA